MFRQRSRVADTRAQSRGICILGGLDYSYDCQVFSICDQLFHIICIARFVRPYIILAVVLIIVRTVHQLKCNAEDIVIRISPHIIRRSDILFVDKLIHHLIQFKGISQSQCIKHKIAHTTAGCEDEYTFIIVLGPAPRFHIVLPLIKLFILRHLVEDICTHHG